jgi:aspartyl-tRNA(Asn)/glutamyl-tRNA(Gln) amidotransferase subunit B
MHFQNSSGVDFNRAGVPLMEIVSEPDINSPEEAFAYLLALKQILLYAGVSDCNLEEGNVRCDVNCSVRPDGQSEFGTKTEIKNLNTFKGVLNALKYEVARQIETLESGGKISQETRRWDADSGVTIAMRTKEYAHDYRYFPEPDLPPVVTSRRQIEELQSKLPELPRCRRERFVKEYSIPEYDAAVLTADMAVADYFEQAAKLSSNPKAVSNWIMTEMMRLLSEKQIDIKGVMITPGALAGLVKLVDKKIINSNSAKEVFAVLFEKGGDPDQVVKEKGLVQVSDTGAIEKFIEQAIADNPKSVADYLGGKEVAAKHIVGQVMKLSRGKANPQLVATILEEKLKVEKQKRDG